jgi:TRAP-type C4-dicarboxylate transport system permease small subunit
MSRASRNPISRFLDYCYLFEDAILILVLATMIGFAVMQIVARNFFGGGIPWADTFLNILVLWVGLVGAMVATRRDHHIAIDALVRFLSKKVQGIVQRLVDLFTAVVCGLLTFHSMRFVLIEYESGTLAFSIVPAWLCQSILPIAFSVIALRYLLYTVVRGTAFMPDPK